MHHILLIPEWLATLREMVNRAALKEGVPAEDGALAPFGRASHDEEIFELVQAKFEHPACAYVGRKEKRHDTSCLAVLVSPDLRTLRDPRNLL